MKTTFILPILLGSSLLTFTLPARAHDHGGTNTQSSQSSEEFEARFRLLPTADAPADAKGQAKVESNSNDGAQFATMKVRTKGLPDGDYTVSAVKASDGSTVDIGQITVGTGGGTNSEADDPDENASMGGSRDAGGPHIAKGASKDEHGESGNGNSELALPSDLDPVDIMQVIVSDTNATAMLVGDLSNTNGQCQATLNATVALTPGDAAPNAKGFARLHSRVRKGKVRNKFLLIASNVPANSVFNVQVDGTTVGTATSNKRGKVMVRKLPATISGLSTVQLTDSSGGEVVRADF